MKEKLLQIIANWGDVCITSLPQMMPEIKGEYAMYTPMKDGYNPNVLMLHGVSQDFIKVFNDLEQNKIIEKIPTTLMIVMIDGGGIYDLPIATVSRVKKSKKECWIPLLIKKGENFPKDIKAKSFIEA